VPIIALARQFASGGSEVASRVASALGWTLLDNDVVDAVAARLGATPAEVASREERVPSLVERLANALTLGTQEWLSPVADAQLPPSDERLLEVTSRVIEEAVAGGPAVVVGRGAQHILGSRDDILSIFCYAPRSALIERCMRRENLSREDAISLVDDTNRHREQWVRAHWDRVWAAPENYDLCVNTHTLGTDGAASIIVRLARERFLI
jgi:cytidylate kinase